VDCCLNHSLTAYIHNRRQFIQSLGAGLIPGVLPASALAADGNVLNDQQLLDSYVRLAGSHDDRLVIWWMDGIRYGVVNAVAKPLYGMKVGMFHRYFLQPDGSFQIAFFELTYYTDLQSGRLLKFFDNPYTGETNKVRHVRLGPEVRELTSQGLMPPKGAALGDFVKEYRNSLGPAKTGNRKIWIPASVEATIQFPKPTAPQILLNLYTTVSGSLADATSNKATTSACDIAFSNVLKWEPWMNMQDRPGQMMSKAEGMKLFSVTDMPDDYIACADEVHPSYIADPVSKLQKQVDKIKSKNST